MTLSSAAEKVKNLRVDTTKEWILEPREGVTTIKVYKTAPAKYILSVDAFNQIGNECQVLELDYERRKYIHD